MSVHDLVLYAGTVFMGFFAIMNPLANTPVFLALTAEDAQPTRRAVARRSLLVALVIVAVFAVAGQVIFKLFGITLPAFRIAGGILVFGIGYSMLQGRSSPSHSPAELTSSDGLQAELSVAISPLAMPILAGPGTIATTMNSVADGSLLHIAVTIAAFASLCGISYAFFVSGEKLVRFLGANAIGAVTRLMGLILVVVGVQMFVDGAGATFKLLIG